MKTRNIKLIALMMLCWLSLDGQAQSPDFFNYQTVVRSDDGLIIASETVGFRFSIVESVIDGVAVYSETHLGVSTNEFGLINLHIGGGTPEFGDFDEIDWGDDSYFIRIEFDRENDGSFIDMGAAQLVSVPYALYANKAGNVFSGEYADLTGVPDDEDLDSLNEIQLLIFDDALNELTIEGGNTIDLSVLDTDTDDQTLTLSGSDLTLEDGGTVDLTTFLDNTDDQALTLSGSDLTLEDGGTIDLTTFLDNTDDQTLTLSGSDLTLEDGGTVELTTFLDNTDDQVLTLSGSDLTLEDGGTVDLATFLDNTDDQALTLSGSDLTLEDGGTVDLSAIDTDTDDQTLTLTGTELTIEDGNTIELSSLSDGVDDADNDPLNEIQSLTLSGTTLGLTGDDFTVELPENLWEVSGSNVYRSSGRVGIGTGVPSYELDVDGSIGMNDFMYHNDDPGLDTYFGFPLNNTFLLTTGGDEIIRADDAGASGTIELVPSNVRTENIPHLTLADDDKIMAVNSTGYLKTVDISELDEYANQVVRVTNENHEVVEIVDNNIVNITEEIILTAPYGEFDRDGLHISGGKITGSGTEVVYFNDNSVVEGVIFENVKIGSSPTTTFIACTFDNVTSLGVESDFENCKFTTCTVTTLIGSLSSCDIASCTFAEVELMTNSRIRDSEIGDDGGNHSLGTSTGCYFSDTEIYLSNSFTGNRIETSLLYLTKGYNITVSGNNFDGKLSSENTLIYIDVDGVDDTKTNINITGNSFYGHNTLPQMIQIVGAYSGSYGLINITGNNFLRASKAITSTSTINTLINNNTTEGILSFGVASTGIYRVVRDNNSF